MRLFIRAIHEILHVGLVHNVVEAVAELVHRLVDVIAGGRGGQLCQLIDRYFVRFFDHGLDHSLRNGFAVQGGDEELARLQHRWIVQRLLAKLPVIRL